MAGLVVAIHVAKNQLGMDDETYREFLRELTGKTSCAKMSQRELWRVMEGLKASGFTQRPRRRRDVPSDPQARKIRALWLAMADEGIIRSRAESAINAYVRRITGRTLRDASVKQAQAVIETLKAWLDRCTEDAARRERCLAVLREQPDAPAVMDGNAVAAAPAACQ